MRWAGGTAGFVFAIDQATKLFVVWYLGLADRLQMDVVAPYLTFRMAWNRGINFGLFAGHDVALRWGADCIGIGDCAVGVAVGA